MNVKIRNQIRKEYKMDQIKKENMASNALRIVLLCGIGMLIVSLILTINSLIFVPKFTISSTDLASSGLAFIGFVMAWPQFERDFKENKI